MEPSEILAALSETVAVIDPDYRIRAVNDAFCHVNGISRCDALSKHCHEVAHGFAIPCWQKGQQCPLQEASETRERARVVHRHTGPGGALRWEEIVATPLFSPDGALRCIVEEMRDVGELLRTQGVLEGLKEELSVLRALVPMCASCKKVRDEDGVWHDAASFMIYRSETAVTHGVCPDCMRELYPELSDPPETGGGES